MEIGDINGRRRAAWALLLKPLDQLSLEDWGIIWAEDGWLVYMTQRVAVDFPTEYHAQYENFQAERADKPAVR